MSCPCYGCTHGLRCPKCTSDDVRLTWSRVEPDGDGVDYVWACLGCGHRWAT